MPFALLVDAPPNDDNYRRHCTLQPAGTRWQRAIHFPPLRRILIRRLHSNGYTNRPLAIAAAGLLQHSCHFLAMVPMKEPRLGDSDPAEETQRDDIRRARSM